LIGCIAFAFLDKILFLFRTKKDLRQYLGVALARIVNIDVSESNPDKVEMGIGVNPDMINDWVNEIWEIFDVDGSGDLDFDELNFFIGEVFRTAGIKIYYNKHDLDDLFSYQDRDNDGTISKDEMKAFLMKLGETKCKHPDMVSLTKYKTGNGGGGYFEEVLDDFEKAKDAEEVNP